MSIPANAKPGDFLVISFDGKHPDVSHPLHWLVNGGFVHIGQRVADTEFGTEEYPYDNFEHAAIYVGKGMIIEAQRTGTNTAMAAKYDADYVVWSSGLINPTDAQRLAIVKAAFGYIGTPYSWVDYAALLAKTAHMLPAAPLLKRYVASTGHMICSQVVDRCYEDGGYTLFDDKRWHGYVKPSDLAKLLLSKV